MVVYDKPQSPLEELYR